MATHEVLNQSPPLIDYNPYAGDPTLQAALRQERGSWARTMISIPSVASSDRPGSSNGAFGTLPEGLAREGIINRVDVA